MGIRMNVRSVHMARMDMRYMPAPAGMEVDRTRMKVHSPSTAACGAKMHSAAASATVAAAAMAAAPRRGRRHRQAERDTEDAKA